MSGAEVLDEYLEGLLQSTTEVPVSTLSSLVQDDAIVAATPAVAAMAADVISEMLADPVFAATTTTTAVDTPAAADVIAEMLSDPAFDTPDATDHIAVDLITEMQADPAFAATGTTESPLDPIAAAVLAELDADPAFAAATSAIEAPAIPLSVAASPAVPTLAESARHEPEQASQATAASTPPPRAPSVPTPPRHLQALSRPADPQQSQPATRVAESSTRWLRLRCGEQAYALELLKVQEVVLPTPLLRLRGAGPAILGIMNLRGRVVPVLDLGLYLGAAAVDVAQTTRVVVVEENGETMGLRVSAVEDVTTLTDHQIEPPDNTRLCKISNHFFRGVARVGQRPMILLDASQLLH